MDLNYSLYSLKQQYEKIYHDIYPHGAIPRVDDEDPRINMNVILFHSFSNTVDMIIDKYKTVSKLIYPKECKYNGFDAIFMNHILPFIWVPIPKKDTYNILRRIKYKNKIFKNYNFARRLRETQIMISYYHPQVYMKNCNRFMNCPIHKYLLSLIDECKLLKKEAYDKRRAYILAAIICNNNKFLNNLPSNL